VQNYSKGDEPVPGSGYRLVEFLGRGGFGEVWKATAPGGAEAAIKIVALDGTKGQKEFRALNRVKRIRHSHLVPIIAYWLKATDGSVLDDAFATRSTLRPTQPSVDPLQETADIGPTGGPPQAAELILAMGLGDKSLSDRLKECRREGLAGIPREELLHHIEDAAEGIDFLNSPEHDLGSGPVAIQHCDIKPDNLMIVGGATQICDFGLARMMGTDRSTSAAATIAYAAPEYLETGEPSESTDQYCLAITYFELLTGKLPYDETTPAAAMRTILAGKLDFSQLPAAEQAVLRRATARDPAGRYPSASAMVKALREAADTDVPSTTEFTSSVGERRRRRRTLVVRVLALLIAIALGGFALQWAPHWKARRALAALDRADAQAAQGEFHQAIADYARAIELNPTMPQAYLGRGRALLAIEDFDKALADFKKAATLNHDARREYADAYLARGTRFLKERQFDNAISDFNEALKYRPDDPLIFSRRAAAQAGRKQWEAAVADYTAAIGIDPEAPDVDTDFVGRGRVHLIQDKLPEAISDFTEACRLNASNAEAHTLLGICCLQQESAPLDKAVAALEAAVQLRAQGRPVPNRDLHDGLALLAYAFADNEQYAEAATWARKAAELAPEAEAEKDLLGLAEKCDSLARDGR